MIKDIHVTNFRSFEDFQMSNLTHVNLIAGKNNVGKTTLLDALDLLIKQQNGISGFRDMLQRRGEYVTSASNDMPMSRRDAYDIKHLFTGRRPKNGDEIIIKTDEGQKSFKLTFVENQVVDLDVGDNSDDDDTSSVRKRNYPYQLEFEYNTVPIHRTIPLEGYGIVNIRRNIFRRRDILSFFEDRNPSLYITVDGIDTSISTSLFDNLRLTSRESKVLEMLKILDSGISRFDIESSGNAIVVHESSPARIPLKSMGDGMSRILGIALSILNLENGYLMADEIDTGLHYRAITDMWKLVISTAKELNIQVFATTHSQDCIISFSEAMKELKDSKSGAYFRLQRRGEKIHAERYNADDLADALESSVEVR